MRLDKFGFPIFEEEEILDYMYENPDKVDEIKYSDILTEEMVANTNYIVDRTRGVADIDESLQVNFLINDNIIIKPYYDLTVNTYLNLKDTIFALATSPEEAGRIEIEFREFERRGLQKMLVMLSIMVTEMRENDIVWGVGRGSSVASYVLYLIGVHKIDSLKYNLDHREFFK